MTMNMREGKRWPGSEWLKDRPRWLEHTYAFAVKAVAAAFPTMKRVAPGLTNKFMIAGEEIGKGYLFNCQMCGQCILHSTGMTCPMNCPKNLRNGPCGGVRPDGHCEVIPERMCVWVQAWERNKHMTIYPSDIHEIQAPLNRPLKDTSAWVNMAEGIDVVYPKGWRAAIEARSASEGQRE
jgi:hypothetical protein